MSETQGKREALELLCYKVLALHRKQQSIIEGGLGPTENVYCPLFSIVMARLQKSYLHLSSDIKSNSQDPLVNLSILQPILAKAQVWPLCICGLNEMQDMYELSLCNSQAQFILSQP